MILLDTSIFSLLLFDRNPGAERLNQRLTAAADTIAVPIVCIEEELRGWLAWIARTKDLDRLVESYRRLEVTVAALARYNVVGFNADAANVYARLRKAHRRIGTMDLRIASIAISGSALLVSRNLKDFGQIEELQVEDWSS